MIPPSIDELRAYIKKVYGAEALDELHALEQKWFKRINLLKEKHMNQKNQYTTNV